MRSVIAGLGVGCLVGVSWPRPTVLRVSAIELVDARGDVVGRLAVSGTGAELVLGGGAQASLVTDGGVAALNLSGTGSLARVVAGDEVWAELPACDERSPHDGVVSHHEVRPPE